MCQTSRAQHSKHSTESRPSALFVQQLELSPCVQTAQCVTPRLAFAAVPSRTSSGRVSAGPAAYLITHMAFPIRRPAPLRRSGGGAVSSHPLPQRSPVPELPSPVDRRGSLAPRTTLCCLDIHSGCPHEVIGNHFVIRWCVPNVFHHHSE